MDASVTVLIIDPYTRRVSVERLATGSSPTNSFEFDAVNIVARVHNVPGHWSAFAA